MELIDHLHLGSMHRTHTHSESASNPRRARELKTEEHHGLRRTFRRGCCSGVPADYLEKVAAIVAKAEAGLASGRSVEAVAREAVAARNALKLAERDAGPWLAARWADLRNVVRYGSRAGPTAQQLFRERGSWEKVLEEVGRTNQTYDRLVR